MNGMNKINNMNTYKLILLKDGRDILVSDEWVKNDWYYCFITNSILKNENLSTADYTNTHYPESWKKIIAGIESLPTLTYSNEVKEFLKTNYRWVDVEELAKQKYLPYQEGRVDLNTGLKREGFAKGFKAHQSITNKMFSLEDMKRAMWEVDRIGTSNIKTKDFTAFVENYIQSLQQPIQLEVEVEITNFSIVINKIL